jgi:uncharacterized membrane protein YccC
MIRASTLVAAIGMALALAGRIVYDSTKMIIIGFGLCAIALGMVALHFRDEWDNR